MFNHSARRAVLLGGLLCAATLARAGCSVSEHASPDIREVVVQHGGYEISTAKCELLNRHNLRLAVTGEAAVLSDVSIGWATVRLISSGNVVSSQVQTSTYVNRFAGSSEVAGESTRAQTCQRASLASSEEPRALAMPQDLAISWTR